MVKFSLGIMSVASLDRQTGSAREAVGQPATCSRQGDHEPYTWAEKGSFGSQ